MDVNYLFHRQQTERSRATAATSEAARRAHQKLADEYERLIEDATNGRISFVPAQLRALPPDEGSAPAA